MLYFLDEEIIMHVHLLEPLFQPLLLKKNETV